MKNKIKSKIRETTELVIGVLIVVAAILFIGFILVDLIFPLIGAILGWLF